MKRIIVALPTCGKTYACKRINSSTSQRAVDLDIRGSKYIRGQLVTNALTEYAKQLFNAGCDVLFVHNGALNFSLLRNTDVTIDIVIRVCTAKQYARLVQERGDSDVFMSEAYQNYDKWTNDMWRLFDNLSNLGFKVRLQILGLKAHIWDYLEDELAFESQCDC